jgi:hypothetical protein
MKVAVPTLNVASQIDKNMPPGIGAALHSRVVPHANANQRVFVRSGSFVTVAVSTSIS